MKIQVHGFWKTMVFKAVKFISCKNGIYNTAELLHLKLELRFWGWEILITSIWGVEALCFTKSALWTAKVIPRKCYRENFWVRDTGIHFLKMRTKQNLLKSLDWKKKTNQIKQNMTGYKNINFLTINDTEKLLLKKIFRSGMFNFLAT